VPGDDRERAPQVSGEIVLVAVAYCHARCYEQLSPTVSETFAILRVRSHGVVRTPE
jgi:hypothetical protein